MTIGNFEHGFIPSDHANFTPAFPVDKQNNVSLRDYFAAKAMHAQLNNSATIEHPNYSLDGLADASYQVADAMLKAREVKPLPRREEKEK